MCSHALLRDNPIGDQRRTNCDRMGLCVVYNVDQQRRCSRLGTCTPMETKRAGCWRCRKYTRRMKGETTTVCSSLGCLASRTYQRMKVASESSQRSIRSRNSQTCFSDILDAVAAGQLHASLELVVQRLKHDADAFLAIVLRMKISDSTSG